MGKAQINPKVNVDGASLIAETAPVTALKTQGRRQVSIAYLGQVTAAVNRMVFRAPPSGATINKVYVNANNEIDAANDNIWSFDLVNQSSSATLNSVSASLSGQTLASTGFKDLGVDQNTGMISAAGLQLQISESGTAETLTNVGVFVEWYPTNDA